jgi:hypothetical protein
MDFLIFLFLFFPYRHSLIMLINGKAFEGTFGYEYTDGPLIYFVLAILRASLNLGPLSFPVP